MRLIALAIVTATLIAGDIIEDMGLMPGKTNSWSAWSTFGLVVFFSCVFFGALYDRKK